MTSCVAASLVGLVILHGQLDSMFDATELQVTDENQFYQLHRVYLWLSTFQWAAAWIWLVLLCYRWTREKMPTRAET